MEKKTLGKLSTYCKKNKITIYKLSQITDVQRNYLGLIDKDPEMNVTFSTASLIYAGTKKKFGTGLHPRKYLSTTKFKWL